jgi:glycerol-3-phosphate dehydrogenase (NAD(P)+)
MAGFYMGQGMTTEEAMNKVNMVVEGVYSAEAVLKLGAKYNVELPIIEQVNKALFEGATVRSMVQSLMTRDKKAEVISSEW